MTHKKARSDAAKALANRLFRAIDNRSCPEVASAIADGASLSNKMKNGQTPLTFAIAHDFSPGASLLLQHGAALSSANSVSALMAASLHQPGSLLFYEILRRSSPQAINGQDDQGRTALMFASLSPQYEGSAEALAALLARGADPDILDENGHNALMFTCSKWGSSASFEILLAATPNLDAVDLQGLSVLDMGRQASPVHQEAIEHEISRRFSLAEQAAMQDDLDRSSAVAASAKRARL